ALLVRAAGRGAIPRSFVAVVLPNGQAEAAAGAAADLVGGSIVSHGDVLSVVARRGGEVNTGWSGTSRGEVNRCFPTPARAAASTTRPPADDERSGGAVGEPARARAPGAWSRGHRERAFLGQKRGQCR